MEIGKIFLSTKYFWSFTATVLQLSMEQLTLNWKENMKLLHTAQPALPGSLENPNLFEKTLFTPQTRGLACAPTEYAFSLAAPVTFLLQKWFE